jgi:hypothetical protein
VEDLPAEFAIAIDPEPDLALQFERAKDCLILDAAQLVVAHPPERVCSPGTAQLLRAEKTAAMIRVGHLPAAIGHRFTSPHASALSAR